MNTVRRALPWVLAIYIAFVFIQSLFYKFTGAPESIYIFSTVGGWLGLSWFEPVGRYIIGLGELLASTLLFVPMLRPAGAALAVCIMTGAIVFHLFSPLGVVVFDDGGLLFGMACGVWISGALIVIMERSKARGLLQRLRGALR